MRSDRALSGSTLDHIRCSRGESGLEKVGGCLSAGPPGLPTRVRAFLADLLRAGRDMVPGGSADRQLRAFWLFASSL